MSNHYDLSRRTISTTGKRARAISIDPVKANAPVLVAQLADALVRFSSTNSNPSSIDRYRGSIHSLDEYLKSPSDRTLSLDHPQRCLSRLMEWEAHTAPLGVLDDVAYIKNTSIKLLIRVFFDPHEVPDLKLRTWANSHHLKHQTKYKPIDEFSNRERLALVNASKKVVKDTVSTIELGRKLVDKGQDPRVNGWEDPANLLWAIINLTYNEIVEADPPALRHPQKARRKLRIYHDISETPWSKGVNPLFGLLVPPPMFSSAIKILILFRTGWTPEEISDLTNSDMRFDEEGVSVELTKLRANRVHTRRLHIYQGIENYWQPGNLLNLSNELFSVGRKLRPDIPNFWICSISQATISRSKNGFLHPWINGIMNQTHSKMSGFIEANDLNISLPHEYRRIRKTVKSAQATIFGTAISGAGFDHTPETFSRHYAQTTSVRIIAANRTITAQETALKQALELQPRFINAEAEWVHENLPSGDVKTAAEETLNESASDSRLNLTYCSDPYSAPSGEGLCMEAPTMCLQCKNAIIFRDHLPRLVYFQKFLERRAKELTPPEFELRYGQQRRNINAILDSVNVDDLKKAVQREAKIYIPLTERESH